MQASTSGNTVKGICRARNFSYNLKRGIIYAILTIMMLPVLFVMLVESEMAAEWISWICMGILIFSSYKLFFVVSALLHPSDGVLGKSLRPYSEGMKEMDIQHLFLQIDKDISLHGTKFGYLWVGKEWVLGAEAMRLDRIRGIFHLDILMKNKHEYGIILVDDRDNVQTTSLWNKVDWEAAYNYLTGLIPAASCGKFDEYTAFIGHSEEEREENNRRFGQKSRPAHPSDGDDKVQFVFYDASGVPTSNATLSQIFNAIDSLEPDAEIFLTPCIPLKCKIGTNVNLSCRREDDEEEGILYDIVLFFREEGEQNTRLFDARFTPEDAKRIVSCYFQKNVVPDLSGWDENDRPPLDLEAEDYVLYVDGTCYEHITFDDVSTAFEELKEGKCCHFLIRTPSWSNGYMWVEGKEDDYTVEVAGFDSNHQECGYSTHTTYGGHVINWLSNYYSKRKYPDITRDWKNISQEIRERNKNSKKE